MKIERLNLQAFKGCTRTIEPAAFTIIAGPNSTGKTAIRDAIVIGLTGEHPQHGKTGPGLFALSSASTMSIQLNGPGLDVNRQWTKKAKSVKATATGTDNLPATPMVMLDAGEFITATDASRLKMIFAVAKVTGSPQEITGIVLAAVTDAEEGKAIESLLTPGEDERDNLQRWIDGTLERMGESQRNQKGEVARLTQAAQGLAALAAGDTAANAASIEKDRASIREALQLCQRKEGEFSARRGAAIRRASEIERFREESSKLSALARLAPQLGLAEIEALGKDASQELNRKQASYRDMLAIWQNQERHRLQAHQLQEQIGLLESQTKDAAAIDAHTKQLQAEGERLDREDQSIQEKREEVFRLKSQVQAAGEKDKAAQEKIAELQAQRSGFLGASCCPTCKASGQNWKAAALAALDEQIEQIGAAAQEALLAANEPASAAHTLGAECDKRAAQAREDRLAMRRNLNAHQARITDGQLAFRQLSEKREALAQVRTHIDPNMKAPKAPDTAGLEAKVEEYRAAWKAAQARDTLAVMTEPEPAESLEELDGLVRANAAEIETIRAQQKGLAQREEALSTQRDNARKLQDAQTARANAENGVAQLGLAIAKMKEQKEEISAKAFNPLLETVARFTAGILPTSVEMNNGEIGRFEEGNWMPLRVFSGTHLAVTAAGIQAALGAQSPAKIVIVDELGRFDEPNKIRFAENVRDALKAGLIDQFIGMDVLPRPWANLPIDGLKVIEFTGKA